MTHRGDAIAQWIRLRLPSCCPWFETQAHHLCCHHLWSQLEPYICLCIVKRTKIKQKGLDWPIFKKRWLTSSNDAELPRDPRSLVAGHLSCSMKSSLSSNILTTCCLILIRTVRSVLNRSLSKVDEMTLRPSNKSSLFITGSIFSIERRSDSGKWHCPQLVRPRPPPPPTTSFERQKSCGSLADLNAADVDVDVVIVVKLSDSNAPRRPSHPSRPPSCS